MKTKIYYLPSFIFTLFLSLAFSQMASAQGITLSCTNFSTGGDGTTGHRTNVLEYTITVTSGNAVLNGTLTGNAPSGTSYLLGSTVVNGSPVSDNGTMPYAGGVPLTLTANSIYTVVFRTTIVATQGTISNQAFFPPLNPSQQTLTQLFGDQATCDKVYYVNSGSPTGIDPRRKPIPNRIVSIAPINGGLDEDIYDGRSGLCKVAPTTANGHASGPLVDGSVLTDATAMAMLPGYVRLYFVNKPVNNVASDLCYIDLVDPDDVGAKIARQYVNLKLTSNTTSNITRMTFDAQGNGYALTENGQEFIHFTINILTNDPTIDPAVTLTQDLTNSPPNFFGETGGDICTGADGKLLFVSNLGHVYRIDQVTNIVKYLGTITNMPAEGCNSIAFDNAGVLYLGGLYGELYKVNLSTLTATGPFSSLMTSSDFASCIIPVVQARVGTNIKQEIERPGTEMFAKVQPNPFRKELAVQVQLNTAEVVKVRLIDFYGRTVYTTSEKMGAGSNSLHLPVPANLGSGIYVVELWAGNNRLLQKKVLKQ